MLMVLGGGVVGHEGGTLVNEIGALTRRAMGELASSLLLLSAPRGHSRKRAICKAGRSLPRTQTCWHPALGLLRLQNGEK